MTTTVYSSNDIMGLLLGGSKAWPKRKRLVQFGRSSCGLTEARCNELLARVHDGMTRARAELSEYRSTHPEFEAVGGEDHRCLGSRTGEEYRCAVIYPACAHRRAISEK